MTTPPHPDADMDDAPPLPTSAEDRKAAAALSSLDQPLSDAPDVPNKQVDTEALGNAIRSLEMSLGGGARGGAGERKAPEKKRVVKVDAEDVVLVMEQLDMSKARATELLRAHEGQVGDALAAFVSVPTWR
ncbi:MAG: hypothetical protein M1829_003636 [Trizodia sp. TS-e1964]|nr:MAG: hypothetical protein M1829_003636 [Trizodia sp. TS-e1964]